jgi:type IV secretory pathway VirB10-like protein
MKKIIFVSLIMFFSGNTVVGAWDGPTKKTKTENNYFLSTGFSFDAILRTAIFSFNTITPVIAETEFDIQYLGKIMIPKGTRIIGISNIEKTVDRVNVTFHTMVFPNGHEIKISGLALHIDGSGGVPGIVKKQKTKLPAKIFLSAIATGAVIATKSPITSDFVTGFANEAQQTLAQKQDYSISVKKETPILIYNMTRIEY